MASSRLLEAGKQQAAAQALIHCPNLEKLDMRDCPSLRELLLWSDKLSELDLTSSKASCSTILGQCSNETVTHKHSHAAACRYAVWAWKTFYNCFMTIGLELGLSVLSEREATEPVSSSHAMHVLTSHWELQEMTKRKLYCPGLTVTKLSTLVPPPRPQKPVHLPIAGLVKVSPCLLPQALLSLAHVALAAIDSR